MALLWDNEKGPPTSLNDSLVATVGGVGVRRREKDHQRVLRTRWCWSWLAMAWDDRKKPPTSRQDSLVVVTGGVSVTQQRKTINESLRLVDGCGGLRWRGKKASMVAGGPRYSM